MKEDILIDLLQRTGKQSRDKLVKALNLDKNNKHPDRQLRMIKEHVNLSDEKYKDVLIVGFSASKGYKIADTEEEYKHFIMEMKARKQSMDIQIEKAERLLKKMEDDGHE